MERNVRRARARGYLSACVWWGWVYVRTLACVCVSAFLRSDSRIPWAKRRQSREDEGANTLL